MKEFNDVIPPDWHELLKSIWDSYPSKQGMKVAQAKILQLYQFHEIDHFLVKKTIKL